MSCKIALGQTPSWEVEGRVCWPSRTTSAHSLLPCGWERGQRPPQGPVYHSPAHQRGRCVRGGGCGGARTALALSTPYKKQASLGVCPPPSQSGPRDGEKHSGTTHSAWWGGPGDPEEGTSSVNVTGMQTPVSQERRGCSLPESLAASGSQAEAGTGPTQPPAVSGELHSAREQVKTTSNQTHARQLFAHVSRQLPDTLAAEFLSSLGRGGEKIYIYLYAGVPAASALHRGLISLPPWSRWPSVLRWPAGRRRLASPRAAPARPESTCSAAARAAKPWARRG